MSRLPPRTASDPRFEEHLLFEATRSWLVELSRRQPLVLVIDDLHWASKPVLLMLMHVLRGAMAESEQTRFLVVGTYRTGELGSANPTAIMLGDLQRLPDVSRTDITGLSLSEVEVFVARAAGQELDEDGRRLSQLIYAETDGNPFFVGEVLRHLAESEAVRRQDQRWIVPDLTRLSVPDTVKDLIRRRVTALSAAASQALTTAAVVGRDFDLEILEAVTGIPDHQLLDAMEEAVRARLVEETGAGWYRFAHALVRGALAEELSQVRRMRFHHAIGTALERVHPTDLASLAHHFAEAGTGRDDRLRAVEYGLTAAGQALEARALADAEARYRAVLVLVESLEPEQERERVEALCGLGEAQRDQGNSDFRSTLLTAARCARDLRDISLLTRAVLANSRGLPSVIGAIDADRVALTESALDLIDPGPSAEHARLLANLAAEIAFGGDDQRRLAVSDAAEHMARSLNDDRLLAWVLNRTGYAAFSPKRVEALVERAEEATRLSDALGDAAEQVLGRYYLSGALLTSGQIERFRSVTEDMLTIAANAPPLIQWFALIMQARVALLEGRFDDAQRINNDALERAQQLGEDDAVNWWASIAVHLELLRGRLDTVVDAVGTYVQAYPDLVAWRLMHVIALCFTGRPEDAKAAVARRPLDAEGLTDDVFPLLASTSACLISFHLHLRPLAERVAATLEPHVAWWAHPYTTVAGPVSCWLALAVCEAGDATRAITLMERADADLSKCSGKGLLPLVRLHFAEVLRRRGAERDDERALALLDLVRQDATKIGAPALVSHADALASLLAAQQAGP